RTFGLTGTTIYTFICYFYSHALPVFIIWLLLICITNIRLIMELSQRIDLLNRVGRYIRSSEESWKLAKQNAFIENAWFIPEFIDYQVNVIADNFLSENLLKAWAEKYNLEEINPSPK